MLFCSIPIVMRSFVYVLVYNYMIWLNYKRKWDEICEHPLVNTKPKLQTKAKLMFANHKTHW